MLPLKDQAVDSFSGNFSESIYFAVVIRDLIMGSGLKIDFEKFDGKKKNFSMWRTRVEDLLV